MHLNTLDEMVKYCYSYILGSYEMNSFQVMLSIFALLSFHSCKHKQKTEEQESIKIQVVEVDEATKSIIKEYVGEIIGYREIPIRARVEGFLQDFYFEEGQYVKAGDLLYVIEPQPYMQSVKLREGQLANAEVNSVLTKKEFERYRPLAGINAVSELDLDTRTAQYESALASEVIADANLELSKIEYSYTHVRAPVDGLIGVTYAKKGAFVGSSPDPVILNYLSQVDTALVQFYMPETDYLSVISGGKDKKLGANKVKLKLSNDSLYSFFGKIDFMNNNVSNETGTILIQASFENPEFVLRSGMFAKVNVEVGKVEKGLFVPQRSVTEMQGKFYVYIMQKDSTFSQKWVEVGKTFGTDWLITEGLEKGDVVVREGLQKIRPKVKYNISYYRKN
ncbi:efflux RND transporter periplasmic adaptor subunit [Aureibacter tunicatorum]|uniref:Membrane fusion protein (Multidrug efflux system) n=1 Tax=Aureibacter tunicatorum TaxID=866807 RepID=A0AAE4BUB5_9BACT|nr:efflux RND transporter periplasmic adaptor subunit [Aureibacter tunicatorum]MDR6240552.1 membrane fusion protein (multidrug efflux system) [Aureibacter tunicatorum]BDD06587.1 acriflavin resistance protein [Aureibacter tunicatorum]